MNKGWIDKHKKEDKYFRSFYFVFLASIILTVYIANSKRRSKIKGGKEISYLILKRGDIVQ